MANSDGKVRIIIDTNADAAAKALDNTSKSFEKTGKSAKNASTVFNSLQQGINQNVEALREMALGGNTNSAEFQRLAQETREYKKAIDEANKAVDKATGGLTNQQSGMNSLISAGKKLVAGYLSFQTVIKAFNYAMTSVSAYREQERAILQLEQTLKNTGTYTYQYSQQIQRLASEIQNYSNYGDEAIIKAQALGQAYAGNTRITEKLTKTVVDFASATGMDLEQAFALVGKSIGSSTNALSRYGVELDKNMTDSQKAEAIQKQLADRFSGSAAQMADTSVQLKNAVGDLSEEIGKSLNPTVKRAEVFLINSANALATWLKNARALKNEVKNLNYEDLNTKLKNIIDIKAQLESGTYLNSGVKVNVQTKGSYGDLYRKYLKEEQDAITRMKQLKKEQKELANLYSENRLGKDDNDFNLGGGGTSSTAKAKDEYEKLQQSVANARREIQLMAIAHGTESKQVQDAFIEYNKLNTQLSTIDALFSKEKVKIDETKGAYQELTEKISKLKTELLDLTTQGDTSSQHFMQLKEEYQKAVDEMRRVNDTFGQNINEDLKNIGNSIKADLTNAIITPLREGETAFDRLKTIGLNAVQMVGQAIIQNLLEQISLEQTLNAIRGISKGIGMAMAGVMAADGAVFQNGNVVPFARGGVVNKPTLFPMANGGTGLMGEAGAEAVMPLRRMSNGRLGVEAQNDKSAVQVNIYNQSDAQIQTRKRDNGSMDIIISKVNEALKSERTSSGFRAAYQREDKRGLQAV